MKLEEAMKSMREGKKLRLKSWGEKEYIFINSSIYNETGFQPLEMNPDVLLAEDWEIVE